MARIAVVSYPVLDGAAVTIAADGDVRWCEAYAKQLNETLQPVHGAIEGVTLIDVTATEITSLASFVFGTASRPT